MSREETKKQTIMPIVAAADFLADRLPEPPQVIHGVIRSGQVGMMAASSKAGREGRRVLRVRRNILRGIG